MEILKFVLVALLIALAMLLFFNNSKVQTNGTLSETQSQRAFTLEEVT